MKELDIPISWRIFLRSAAGQLTLLGILYGGALVLALVAVCFRGEFRKFVREKYPPLSSDLKTLAIQFLDGRPDVASFEALSETDVDAVYGAWVSQTVPDPQAKLAAALWRWHGPSVVRRVRLTLVAGNEAQRMRGLDLLAHVPPGPLRQEAADLCRHALATAQRAGADEIERRAVEVLNRLTMVTVARETL